MPATKKKVAVDPEGLTSGVFKIMGDGAIVHGDEEVSCPPMERCNEELPGPRLLAVLQRLVGGGAHARPQARRHAENISVG